MKGFSIKDNTVSAVNQVTESESVYFLGNANANKKVLILGNSITRHGVLKDIGWEHDWGMAASERELDYVHKLYKKMDADCYFLVRQASYWEMNYQEENVLEKNFIKERDFGADVVVFMLGENVHNVEDKTSQVNFYNKLKEFAKFFIQKDNTFIFTTCVWKNDLVDETIINLAKELNMPVVDLNCVGIDNSNLGGSKYWHGGVAGHPGDKGMELIANLLAEEVNKIV